MDDNTEKYLHILGGIFGRQTPNSPEGEQSQQAVQRHLREAVEIFRRSLWEISRNGFTIDDKWVLPNLARSAYLSASKGQYLEFQQSLDAKQPSMEKFEAVLAQIESTRAFVQSSFRGHGLRGELPRSLGHIALILTTQQSSQDELAVAQILGYLFNSHEKGGRTSFDQTFIHGHLQTCIEFIRANDTDAVRREALIQAAQRIFETYGDPDVNEEG